MERITKMLIISIVFLLISGCANTCSQSGAIIAAKNEIIRNGGHGEFETKATKVRGGWSVVVWALPKTPGGFAVVHVNHAGNVVSVEPGH